jgi:DNA helicase-2/ATP-dependent DNA helicase PcrA
VAARTLLSHNHRRVDKRIVEAPGRISTEREGLFVSAPGDALSATVQTVTDLLSSAALPKDIAVLTRVNASLAAVQVALVHREVPVRPAVDASYLSRGGVQAALAWLRLAVAPAEHLAGSDVAMAARRPSRAMSPKLVEWMGEQRSLAKLERLAGRVKDRDADKVFAFISDLKALRKRASSGTTVSVLRSVRDDLGLDTAMELLEGSRRRLDRSAQTDDLDALVALGALHPKPAGFENWLRESLSHPGAVDGVTLSTVHRVKGREWPHVVLHEVSAGLLPHRLAVDIEEERRIFHVGLTRCSSSVHVVPGEQPSPFLRELDHVRTVEGPPSGGPRRGSTGAPQIGATPGRPGRPEPVGAGAVRAGVNKQLAATTRTAMAGRRVGGRAAGPEAVGPEIVDRVREALRAWRSARAAAEHKPAFIFLHDRTMEALATEAPTTMSALARVSGIGPAKLEAYGDELLAIIASARDAG